MPRRKNDTNQLQLDIDHTHNAWVIGEHDLPLEFEGIDAAEGSVVVVDIANNTFDIWTIDEFDEQFEWITA